MTTPIAPTTPAAEPSDKVLLQTPARFIQFCMGINTHPDILGIMRSAGWSEAKRKEGADLLEAATAPFKLPGIPNEVSDAVHQLDAWDEVNFAKARACLTHEHPAQAAIVFDGDLKASKGYSSIFAIATFLKRLDALEKSGSDVDKAALAALAERGITSAERARAAALVATAVSVPEVTVTPDMLKTADVEHHAALVKLYEWYQDWSDTARAVLDQRAMLIKLGLAHRKPAAAAPAPAAPAAAPPAVPGVAGSTSVSTGGPTGATVSTTSPGSPAATAPHVP